MEMFVMFRLKYVTRLHEAYGINEPPHRVSLSFAIGIFISFIPIPGIQTISAVLIAWLFKLNIAVTVTGTLFSNPLTLALVFGVSFCFGNFVLGNATSCFPQSLVKEELLLYFKEMPLPLFTGSFILGTATAITSYFLLFWALLAYQKNNTE